MPTLVKQFDAVGESWGISSVNKAVTNDTNKLFYIKFIINSVTTVTYDGVFDYSRTAYSDRYSNKLNSVEQNSYINISDMRSIVRDYPTITDKQLNMMFQRLLNTCLEAVIVGVTDFSGYTLCVNLDGTLPSPLTIPALPTA